MNSEISLATRSEEGRGNIESQKEQKIVQREPQVCNCAIMPFPVARKWAGSSYLRFFFQHVFKFGVQRAAMQPKRVVLLLRPRCLLDCLKLIPETKCVHTSVLQFPIRRVRSITRLLDCPITTVRWSWIWSATRRANFPF